MWRAVLLSGIAGLVDAHGYITLGGVFAANMTGNTVLLALSLLAGDWTKTALHGVILVAFALGAVAGHVLLRLARRPLVPLMVEAALLGLGALPMPADLSLAVIAFAMGIQLTAMARFGTLAMSTIVVTANLGRIGIGLTDLVWKPRSGARPDPAHIATLAGAWLAYGVGAAGSVLAAGHAALPLAVSAVLVVVAGITTGTAARDVP